MEQAKLTNKIDDMTTEGKIGDGIMKAISDIIKKAGTLPAI